jgi:hypothetical protein
VILVDITSVALNFGTIARKLDYFILSGKRWSIIGLKKRRGAFL